MSVPPLLGSFLGFSSGHFSDPQFYFPLLAARFTLIHESFAVFHLLSVLPWSSIPGNHLYSVQPYGETPGRFSLIEPEKIARDKIEATSTTAAGVLVPC